MKNKSEVSTGSDIDLNILFNLSEDIQCIVDTAGYFEKANPCLIQHSGLTEPKLLANSLLSIIHPEDRECVNNRLLTMVSGSTANFEARLIQSKSSDKGFAWIATALDGYIYLSAKSISNQTLVPKELQQSLIEHVAKDSSLEVPSSVESDELPIHNEHRFQSLVQNSSDLLAILSLDGDYQFVSPSVKRILGFDCEYLIGKNAFSFIHPDDLPRLLSVFESVVKNIKVEIPPYRFISSDGKWHWLETIVTNMLHDPAVRGIVANSRDITIQREMEHDILRNARRFKNLIEHNRDGSFTLSRDFRFTSFNSVIRNLKGLPEEIKVGANLSKAMENGHKSPFYSEFNRAFEQNIAVHFKEFSPLFNKWFEINAYPFEDSLTVMIRDITESKIQTLTLSLEKEVLEMNAASANSLGQLVDHLLSGFEKIHYGLKTSLSIVDEVNNKLHRISAPAMPELFDKLNTAVELSSGKSPCTKAAFNRSEVYIENILSVEITADFREILDSHNIRSSRSIPVINKNQEVIAVFTIFNNGHKHALMEDNSLIQRLGTIIQLLLENSQAKKDAELSNERFELTMKATSDSIWDYNLNTNQVYRGNGFGNYYNQEPGMESIDSKKWELNIHPEDAKRVEQTLEKALNDRTIYNWIAEYRYLKKDGSYALVIDKGLIVRDTKGQPLRIVGAVQDITEIKKNQEKLIQSEENYKNMFSNNPTPMWTYDMESKGFTMVNDAALELYGYTREEFLKLNLFSIRIEEDHEKLRMHLKSIAFLEDQNISHEWTHLKKDKTRMIVDVISHPLLINGRRSRLVAIKDITDKKKDRQEILAQNQRLREIAQISSHETRKPLASILGLVNLLDQDNWNNPLNKEIVQYLEISANELDTVIHNIVKKTWLESEASSAFRPDN